ncbi:MAG: tetratricopeptide repeat protein [Candidatus Melainabacteria bacterium]
MQSNNAFPQPPASNNGPEDMAYPLVLQSDAREMATQYLRMGNAYYHATLKTNPLGVELKLTQAADCFTKALEHDPQLAEAYVKLAAVLVDKGDITPQQALNYCQQALSINPRYAEANLFSGYFHRINGSLEAAVSEFRTAIHKAPLQSGKARMALGRTWIDMASRQPTAGLKRSAWMVRGVSDFTLGLLHLPFDPVSFGKLARALTHDVGMYGVLLTNRVLGMLGRKNLQVNLMHWATRRMPDEAVLHHLLGDLLVKTRQLELAIQSYGTAQRLDPENPLLNKKLGSIRPDESSVHLVTTGLEITIATEKDDFEALYNLAQIYSEQGDYMRALYYFKELAAQYVHNPYVHSNMAYVLFKMEDYEGAIQEYQHAINYGTDSVWLATVAQTLGTIYYQVKQDYEAALNMFQMAYQLDSGNMECLMMMAELLTELGHYEAAISAYRHLLRHEPENADAHNFLGYLLWQTDQNEEAVGAYLKAIEFDPGCYIAYNNLGVIYLDEYRNPEKAEALFRKALSYKPDYTLASFNIGRAQEMAGLRTEAAKSYSYALALNEQNPELTNEEILSQLDALFKV